ncbi:MAG: MBL fold metallo-hydrolase, partial [Clostridiales bacterium]|nr:MBL fold metallo-hydrolase [Clostridiales bacterium]
DWQTVSDFISAEGYDKIDYLVGTHPHEDHIGGLDKIIDNFQIGELFMPDATNTTKTFEDVLDAAESKNLEITVPKSGDYIVDEGNLTATVIAPNSADYKDFNDYSIVIKLIYGDTSFLFQGDAESLSEQEILDAGFDVSSDVIKLGHHGSSTSSSADYLDAVGAEYAVIMCGKDNSYGHPHEETMQKLQQRNIEVLRTDEQGTITIRSDGTKIML